MALTPGQILNNRYRIVKLLGQGGFGAVYKAWHLDLNIVCALKENLDTSPEAQRQFAREATLLATLRHPNLPRVIDHFTIPGQGQYLAMDFVEGEDLQAMLDTAGNPLSEGQVLPWIVQVCDALTYLHTHNPPVIHRDIKPANIKITPDGQAMLVDFGIAKTYNPNLRTTLGARAVTPGYSPPEQYGQGVTDARSDIYALGATLYTLLTGRTPPDSLDVLTHRIASPVPARTLNPNVSPQVSAAVEKAMQPDWAQRFARAADFAEKLRQQPVVQTSQPPAVAYSSTAQVSPPPPARPPSSVFPWSLLLLGILALSLFYTCGWAIKNFIGQPNPTVTERAVVTQSSHTPSSASPTYTLLPPTPSGTTLPPTITHTAAPPTLSPTPTLGIGSFQISDKDGMKLLYVPAGEFLMGSTDSDSQAPSDEKPQHTIYLDAFWIDQTEVTNAMYKLCVQAGLCLAPSDTTYYADAQFGNYPVVFVSWNDAQAYCQWSGKRLPTEAQWEKAARGTDGRLYPWGNSSITGNLANFCDINCQKEWKDKAINDGYAVFSPVGNYPAGASPYGALDMAGNVWEWVADWYGENYYASSPSSNPTGPVASQYRVLRGCSWDNEAQHLRAANRNRINLDNRYDNNGFRCAR